MNTRIIRNPRKQGLLLCALFLLPLLAGAQTFMALHSFDGSDGFEPDTGLILSGNTLYGTAPEGGLGYGVVFAVNTDGTGFTNLYTFTGGKDGAIPMAGLILSGNTLYGTASAGGSNEFGTVYAVNTNGTNFTILHSFTGGTNGANPLAGLTLSGDTLYGTAESSGNSGAGTIFAVNTNGAYFTNLHNFNPATDGGGPGTALAISGNILFGTANFGGSSDGGAIFAIQTNGAGFTNLHNFLRDNDGTYPDGTNPQGGLVLSGNTLYGTAYQGGSAGAGTIFAINTDGSGFTNLYSFTACSDAGDPESGLVVSGHTLYGAVQSGGVGYGTIFALNTDGTGFTNFYNFTGGNDGAFPIAGLILSGNFFYGTAQQGGTNGDGTIFSLSLPPPALWIAPVGNQITVYWPASATNYVLQTTTNLSSTNWATVSSGAPIVGVTLPNCPSSAFFRLQQQ